MSSPTDKRRSVSFSPEEPKSDGKSNSKSNNKNTDNSATESAANNDSNNTSTNNNNNNNNSNNDSNNNNNTGFNPSVTIDPTKDLWANILANVKDNNMEIVETNVLVVGQSGAGKTSLLSRVYSNFQGSSGGASSSGGDNNTTNNNNNDDDNNDNQHKHSKGGNTSSGGSGRKVKPTTALDYTFARRTDRNSSQVAHFFELAQGRDLEKLSELIVSPENIHNIVLFVVVDVSEANVHAAFAEAFYWLQKTDERAEEIFKKMRAKGSSTPDKMINRAHKALGGADANPDIDRMRLSGIPVILMVNKMDLFTHDTGRLKLMVRAFRFLAHLYGAHVVFTQAGEQVLSHTSHNAYRALVSHILFNAPFDPKYIQGDCEKDYVLLTANKDTFVEIGDPPIVSGGGGGGANANTSSMSGAGAVNTSGDPQVDRWRVAYEDAFPLTPESALYNNNNNNSKGKGGDAFIRKLYELGEDGFGEPTIDALRRQKDEELEQYRKGSRKK